VIPPEHGASEFMKTTIESIVQEVLRQANLARPADQQLDVAMDAPLFGEGSRLDSLALVALVIDVEDGLRAHGVSLDLSDAQALSRRHSPFRTTRTLVDYIASRVGDGG
jgi:acyl carrier protein